MGFSGLVAISKDVNINPDLAFFLFILKKQNIYISSILIFLAVSLTISNINTIINAISSLLIVDGNKILSSKSATI